MAVAKKPTPDPELAEVNAELAAEGLAAAEKQAADAERQLAEAMKEDPKSRLCPHDNAEMVKHEGGEQAGAWHCNSCGCCFVGGKPRAGHPTCSKA